MGGGSGDGDALNNSEIIINNTCCCCYDGFVLYDQCFGCMQSHTVCCCEAEYCLKSGTKPLCLFCCAYRCVNPTVCIKVQHQMCCHAIAFAFPCDNEVPCMVGLCGLVCCPTLACCTTLGEINNDSYKDNSGRSRRRSGSAARRSGRSRTLGEPDDLIGTDSASSSD